MNKKVLTPLKPEQINFLCAKVDQRIAELLEEAWTPEEFPEWYAEHGKETE